MFTIDTSEQVTPDAAGEDASRRRVEVLGCRIDALDMDGTIARAERLVAERGLAQHVAINAAKLVSMQGDPELRDVVANCELVTADGQAVVWASRILGHPLPTRVAGIDLMHALLELAERRGLRVFVLGAKPEILERAVGRIRERHPRLQLAGSRHGYFEEAEDAEIAEAVQTARADVLFVAISSPKKEYWLGRYGRQIGVPFVMGVGGSIDVVAGQTRRAPPLLQRLGLEWAFRLSQEPRRLWRRYLVTNTKFIALVARAWLAQRLGRRSRSR